MCRLLVNFDFFRIVFDSLSITFLGSGLESAEGLVSAVFLQMWPVSLLVAVLWGMEHRRSPFYCPF